MDPFLDAQTDSPFDSAPMLIRADFLEEAGDLVGAAVLRGLVEGGTPSLHALALEATLASVSWDPDMLRFLFDYEGWDGAGDGSGDGHAAGYGHVSGHRHVSGYGLGIRDEHGSVDGDEDGNGTGYGNENVDDDRFGDRYGDGNGDFYI